MRLFVFVTILLFACCRMSHGDIVRTYQIGNSLTVTATPSGALANWASYSNGDTLSAGLHIRCGQPLQYIFDNPTDTCVTPPFRGYWQGALNGFDDWDHIVFQPHTGNAGSPSTLSSDETVINTWISQAIAAGNGGSTFYVMQGYPTQNDFQDKWNNPVDDLDTTPTVHATEYYQHLMKRLRAANPGVEIYLIPVGEVFLEIDRELALDPITIGEVTFDGIADFYRDENHGNVYGGLASGAAIFASMFGESTEALTSLNSGGKYGLESKWSSEMYQLIHAANLRAHQTTNYSKRLAVPEPGQATLLILLAIAVFLIGRPTRVRLVPTE